MADNRKTLLKSSTSLISMHYSLVKALFVAAPFLVNQAYAQTCTTMPSCVSLGYSKSSAACTNKIYCPFDTSYTICLDPTETKPKTCTDFGYYSQGNLADLKKKGCAHPNSKYCVCNEVSESEVTDLDLLCYSACNEPTMTCNKINSSYGTRAEKAAEVCEFDDRLCQCGLVTDDPEVTMRGLECYSGCSERAFVCSNESQGWLTEAEAKIEACDDLRGSSFCKCNPVERTTIMENRDLDCYAPSLCTVTEPSCSQLNSSWLASESVAQGYSCTRVTEDSTGITAWERNELAIFGLTCYKDCEQSVDDRSDGRCDNPGCDHYEGQY